MKVKNIFVRIAKNNQKAAGINFRRLIHTERGFTMNYDTLLDLVAELGYNLAMCGAETFRIEESATRGQAQ